MPKPRQWEVGPLVPGVCHCEPWARSRARRAPEPRVGDAGSLPGVQTRYLILASLITGLVILTAAAIWFSGL